MTRVRTLAKELAEGAAEGVWGLSITSFRGAVNDAPVITYFDYGWSDSVPNVGLLVSNGYLSLNSNPHNSSQATLNITKSAFDLLEENEPYSIFISYRRDDSSAFALLVLAR